jgi:hypothetical protein
MTEQRKNFLGIPVIGDLQFSGKRVSQRPLDELSPLMQDLLDDPTITWFGWTQYTPYFNDGEPCIFSIHGGLAVGIGESVTDDHDISDDDEYDDISEGVEYNSYLGKRLGRYDDNPGNHPIGTYTGPDEARYDRCLVLERALNSSAFDDVLLEHFGDHCSVLVTKTSIRVSEYSHD